jgi:hypothetical protein
MANSVYSFMNITAGIVGPGLVANLGDGSAAAEEGIEIAYSGDINGMTIGADGEGMHSLYADRSGTITVNLLKVSPMNKVLSAAAAFQRSNPASHGQNTFTLVDKLRGDVVTAQQCAFKKIPDLTYGKDARLVAWEFHAIKIDGVLA